MAKNIINELNKEGQVTRKYYQRRLPSDSSKDYYYMLRNTPNTEALIIEYGFLDNTSDANRLKENYQNYAEAVIRAVANYKNLNYVPKTGSNYYIVKKGDTLWSIARDNNITVQELKNLNNLASNSLSIGDILKLPTDDNDNNVETSGIYTVKKGDTLYSIARKYNITVDELKRINNLTSNSLSIGQQLKITELTGSDTPNTSVTYTVKKGDTLYTISRKYNISVDELKKYNNLTTNTLSINQVLRIPTSTDYRTYKVQRGDTLYSIARKYNVTVNELKTLNNLSSNVLNINQELLIPN